MKLWYRIRRRLFLWLMPKDLTAVFYEDMATWDYPGTCLMEPTQQVGWGAVKVKVYLLDQVKYSFRTYHLKTPQTNTPDDQN